MVLNENVIYFDDFNKKYGTTLDLDIYLPVIDNVIKKLFKILNYNHINIIERDTKEMLDDEWNSKMERRLEKIFSTELTTQAEIAHQEFMMLPMELKLQHIAAYQEKYGREIIFCPEFSEQLEPEKVFDELKLQHIAAHQDKYGRAIRFCPEFSEQLEPEKVFDEISNIFENTKPSLDNNELPHDVKLISDIDEISRGIDDMLRQELSDDAEIIKNGMEEALRKDCEEMIFNSDVHDKLCEIDEIEYLKNKNSELSLAITDKDKLLEETAEKICGINFNLNTANSTIIELNCSIKEQRESMRELNDKIVNLTRDKHELNLKYTQAIKTNESLLLTVTELTNKNTNFITANTDLLKENKKLKENKFKKFFKSWF